MDRTMRKGYIAAVLTVLLSAFSYPVRDILLQYISSSVAVCLQTGFAWIFLLLYHFIFRKKILLPPKAALQALLSGLLGIAGYQFLILKGTAYVGGTTASAFLGLIPILCYLWEITAERKKPTCRAVTAIAVSFLGVLLLSPASEISATGLGILYLFLADIAWVLYCVLVSGKDTSADVKTVLMYQAFSASVIMFFICRGELFSLMMGNEVVWFGVVYQAVFNTIGNMIFAICAIRILGATQLNLITNTIPVVTLVMYFFLFDSKIRWQQAAGIFFTVAAVYLLSDTQKEQK